jgi:hypothetical protein
MSRTILTLCTVLALAMAAGANPVDLIVESEGVVFVSRGGEQLPVTSVPFTIEMGDIVRVNPGGRAVLPGDTPEEPVVLTVESGPRTFTEPRPLVAMLLSTQDLEVARAGGTDFSTMRSSIHLSQSLASPRNTALLAPPEGLVIALPMASVEEFLFSSEDETLTADVTVIVFGADDPLITTELIWTREELEALLDSGQEEDLRTVDLSAQGAELPTGEQIVTLVSSPALQAIARSMDPSERPPQDRAWFRILREDERLTTEGDLAHLESLCERMADSLGAAEGVLWRAGILSSHGLTRAAISHLEEQIESLAGSLDESSLDRLRTVHANLTIQVETPWDPNAR